MRRYLEGTEEGVEGQRDQDALDPCNAVNVRYGAGQPSITPDRDGPIGYWVSWELGRH